jgi:hypothetical protein
MKKRPFRRGKAAPHIGAAKPLRTDFLCEAGVSFNFVSWLFV